MTPAQLIHTAQQLVGRFSLSKPSLTAAAVGVALITDQGNVYTGINTDFYCGIGFCAEHAAVAEMLKHRETQIAMIVAVDQDRILPPCGRCRELMHQVDANNRHHTQVILAGERLVLLRDLLPDYWIEEIQNAAISSEPPQ
jgi:cytidine deaminase